MKNYKFYENKIITDKDRFKLSFDDEINKCLENTEQEQVLLKSPHFCKKVYHYLMKPEII